MTLSEPFHDSLILTLQAPLALDIHSPIDLVYQCFVKLGLRYLCVNHDGQYAGLVHKKAFVKYMKEHE
jgi:chloride channel 3/4/5